MSMRGKKERSETPSLSFLLLLLLLLILLFLLSYCFNYTIFIALSRARQQQQTNKQAQCGAEWSSTTAGAGATVASTSKTTVSEARQCCKHPPIFFFPRIYRIHLHLLPPLRSSPTFSSPSPDILSTLADNDRIWYLRGRCVK